MINLSEIQHILPGPWFTTNTIFYELDQIACIEDDFDISFISHIQYGSIENIVRKEILWSEDDCQSERIQFDWDAWTFEIEVYTSNHNCPSCQCSDYPEAIREAIRCLI